MAYLKRKESLGIKQVVHIEVEGEIYSTINGFVSHNCKVCKSMYHDDNNLRRPKPYKLSEVATGYLRLKEWDWKTPYFSGHPNCRHLLNYIPKDFTIDAGGNIKFHSFGYDYYQDFWGKLGKSESNHRIDSTSLEALESFLSHSHE